MTNALLAMVLDILLPGDDGGPGVAPLPCASGAEVDLRQLEIAARPMLEKINAAWFEAAGPAERIAALREVQRSAPEDFRRLLECALAAYYQAPSVLSAFGWRSEPPMPLGHQLAGDDAATLRLLDTVRQRGKLWRG